MGFFYKPLETTNLNELKNHKKKIDIAYLKTQNIRGFIITSSIELEFMLNNLIRIYYCIHKPKELRHVKFWRDILNNLSFEKKIKIVKNISIHKKKIFRKKYVDFIKRLDKIRIVRNKIAHDSFLVGRNMNIYLQTGIGPYSKYEVINRSFKKKFKKETMELMDICITLEEYIKKINKEQ